MLDRIKNLFINPPSDPSECQTKTYQQRQQSEKQMLGLVAAARDRALSVGKWSPTQETAKLEEELLFLFGEVCLGGAGTGHYSLEDFKSCCSRWEASGNCRKNGAESVSSVADGKHICSAIGGTSADGDNNPLLADAKRRAQEEKEESNPLLQAAKKSRKMWNDGHQ